MSLKEPVSMDDLVYFSRRKLGEHGKVICWAYRKVCTKCKKAKMGKPINPKTGRPKSRSKEYVCPGCSLTLEKEEYENTLILEAKYTCPHCKKPGESTAPFIKKSFRVFDEKKQKKVSVKAIRLTCEHCTGNIDITPRMK